MAVITRPAPTRARADLRTLSWRLALASLGAIALALAVAVPVGRLYTDRVLPGVTVAGIDVGSLSREDSVARLESAVGRPFATSSVVATYDGRTWRATNAALGVHPDIAGAADRAVAYGKTPTLGGRLAAWVATLTSLADIPLAVRSSGDALDRWAAQIAAETDRPAVSGALAIGPTGLVVTEPVVGAQLDRAATKAAVLRWRPAGDREIALSVRDIHPEIDEAGMRDALARARAITTPLLVSAEDREVKEDAAGLATLLDIQRGPTAYTVSLDEHRVATWVSALAARLDRPGTSARYTVNKDGVLGVAPGIAGIRVDQDALRSLLVGELPIATGAPRQILAPTVPDRTVFTTRQAEEWLPRLTKSSTFTTPFAPSATRHANIATGSSQFDGVVILPGQTFSFWQLLGPVTVERGYAYAGAIIENRSNESVIGGGLCQVSTTIFNAVASLGYEIVERHEHGYLIERYPLGLDAAVFEPGLDTRWRNDTSSPVFLWSWVGDTSVTFDVWGVPTGRTVTFSDPAQWRFVDVPKDQPADPAFPAGYAIRGRDVVRTRTVTENGTVLYSDTFYSHYAPVWGGPAPAGQTLTIR